MRGYSRAFIEIQDGCECSCSYCIIPKARGAEVSRPSRLVVEQARNLARSGYREMVLTGIHIGRYRDGEMGLTGLLERLLHDKMGMRLRLSSIEPEEVTQGLIDLLAAQTGLCPHLHIAIQSADDGIIRAMNRGYTQGLLSELLAGIASRVPGVTLGADLMVGFPGETERSFLNTMSFVEASPLAYLHVFSYSDRPGTAASSFKRKVSPEEKSRRSRLLVALGRSKKRKHLKGFLGRELGVLVESRRHRKSGLLTGLSDNYLRLVFEGPDELKGRIVKVKALHLLEGELRGELV